jgi:hypothetical protein
MLLQSIVHPLDARTRLAEIAAPQQQAYPPLPFAVGLVNSDQSTSHARKRPSPIERYHIRQAVNHNRTPFAAIAATVLAVAYRRGKISVRVTRNTPADLDARMTERDGPSSNPARKEPLHV